MSSKENGKTEQDVPELSSKDLQLILRAKLGENFQVLDIKNSNLLPPGENFACSLVKIEARIVKEENEEELHLVGKILPSADFVRQIFDFSKLFQKEIFFYDKLVPTLRELDSEFLAEGDTAFDTAPELYGFRFSYDQNSEKIDDGVILLLDNLKSKGYYTGHKTEGLDLEHSRATIKALAEFHALSIACKHHKPDFFIKEVLTHAVPVPFKEDKSFDLFQHLFNMMLADSRFEEHRDRLASALCDPSRRRKYFEFMAEEPWLSIAHSDFWTNNILFQRNSNNELADVKFIDFQAYQYNSPLRDLPYFLCASTTSEVLGDHLDELLDLYHESFIATLRRTKIEEGPFKRESFDRQLKVDAGLEFFHCIIAIKFFHAEIDAKTYDPDQLDKVVLQSQINKHGLDRWYQIVQTYVKRGWL